MSGEHLRKGWCEGEEGDEEVAWELGRLRCSLKQTQIPGVGIQATFPNSLLAGSLMGNLPALCHLPIYIDYKESKAVFL